MDPLSIDELSDHILKAEQIVLDYVQEFRVFDLEPIL
jgi:hypothetical protein